MHSIYHDIIDKFENIWQEQENLKSDPSDLEGNPRKFCKWKMKQTQSKLKRLNSQLDLVEKRIYNLGNSLKGILWNGAQRERNIWESS